jgi:hypothetical protein
MSIHDFNTKIRSDVLPMDEPTGILPSSLLLAVSIQIPGLSFNYLFLSLWMD